MLWRRSRFALAAVVVSLLAIACGQEGATGTESAGTGAGGAGGGSASGGGGAGIGGTPLAVLNWNAHNFFNATMDSDDLLEPEVVLSASDYESKLQAIGAVVAELDPDIAFFAEIEHQSILDDMNEQLLGGAYQSFFFEGNDGRGLDVGLLTKIPPDDVISHKDESFTREGTTGPVYQYARDCLEVHLTHGGKKIVLLGVHFRSKGGEVGTDDPDKRLAEAQHTRAIANDLLEADPSLAVVILGDYNDEPGSPALDAILGDDFADATDAVDDAERYTFVYQGRHELLDHQVSNGLMTGWLAEQTVVIRHGVNVDDSSEFASDHAPIFAIYGVQ